MVRMATKDSSPLNPFPSTYKDRPHPSDRFRPPPDDDYSGATSAPLDYTWYGEPLSKTLYEEEGEESDDDAACTSGRRSAVDHSRQFTSPHQSSSLPYTADGFIPNSYYGPVSVSADGSSSWKLVAADVIEESHLVLISGPPLVYLASDKSITSSAELLGAVTSYSTILPGLSKLVESKVRSGDAWTLHLLNPSRPLLRGFMKTTELQTPPSLDMYLKPEDASIEVQPVKEIKKPKRFSSLFGKTASLKKLPQFDFDRISLENSVSGLHHDAAASLCRGEHLAPFGAIWPEVSLMNHSCLPNSSLVVIGTGNSSRAIIRASRTILPGEDITISRLSSFDLLSPLLARREATAAHLGFTCPCDRCKVEESEAYFLSLALHSIYGASIAIRRQLEAILESPRDFMGDAESSVMEEKEIITKACQLVLDDAETLLKAFKDETAQLDQGSTKGLALMIDAGSFSIYEMMATCSQHLQGYGSKNHTMALNNALYCADQVARGSELHTVLSAMLVKMSRASNGSPHLTQSVIGGSFQRQCLEAHQIRYGSLEGSSVAQLSSASLSCGPLLFSLRSAAHLAEESATIARDDRNESSGFHPPTPPAPGVLEVRKEAVGFDPAAESGQPTDSWGIPIVDLKHVTAQ